jgi:hypothetical protein
MEKGFIEFISPFPFEPGYFIAVKLKDSWPVLPVNSEFKKRPRIDAH